MLWHHYARSLLYLQGWKWHKLSVSTLNVETTHEGQENRNEQDNQSLTNYTFNPDLQQFPVKIMEDFGHNQKKYRGWMWSWRKPNSTLLSFNLSATHFLDTDTSQTGFHFGFVALASSQTKLCQGNILVRENLMWLWTAKANLLDLNLQQKEGNLWNLLVSLSHGWCRRRQLCWNLKESISTTCHSCKTLSFGWSCWRLHSWFDRKMLGDYM